ncbi:cytochrome P450 [Pyrrhoderma noxium]|uniref:Cytochrome P450 n=1 Tax=Pyrrhoderma noxium TaxID=2282107 RepID=A0A286U6Y1_9AGAM|nr:cytochrome P450 [Pyrrhoderma noxium]
MVRSFDDSADLITRATYGYGITSISDPFISIAERGMEAFADAQGFYLVNELPWLQFLPSWLPGMGFRRVVEDGYKSSMDMYKKPYETFKKKQEIGLGSSSFSAKLLGSFKDKNGDVNKADEEFIAKVTSIIYAGGADTTVSTLLTFILAMVLHPDVQRKAQEEYDEVIGNNILPTFEDLQKLTYLDAVRKECLRWQSVVASSAPHTVSRDDEVDGYLIPENSIIMGNIWAILRDPVEYPDPDRFIPERFIPVENKKCPLEPNRVVFSVGRRVCPGKHFAESSIFIDMATIIATCDIGKTLDNYGNPIVPDVEYTKQLIRHPLPFKCLIKPRNKEFEKLLCQNIETEYSAGN